MKLYRKKPVIIQAEKYDGTVPSAADIIIWADQNNTTIIERIHWEDGFRLVIPTLEGNLEARPGDYIIRGVKGEFYPCKPEIFEATYEPVEETEPMHIAPRVEIKTQVGDFFKGLFAIRLATKGDLVQLKQEILTMVDQALTDIRTAFDKYKADVNAKVEQLQQVIANGSMSAEDKAAAQDILNDITGADTALTSSASTPSADAPPADAPVEAPVS